MFPSRMSVVVESRLECVPLAGILVRTFCSNSGFSEVESGQIEVCIMEAANNCVVHAYRRESGRPVEVIASRKDGAIQFEVWDEGRPMDPELLSRNRSHLLELNQSAIEGAPESGRGLAIIEAIMDGIGYSTSGGRNRFWMTKRVACESVTT